MLILLLATSTVPVPFGTKLIFVFVPPAVKVKAPVPVIEPFEVPVPPLATANCPVHPNVKDAAFIKAVDEEPPKVNVTLVSSVLVRAAPEGIWLVKANVPVLSGIVIVFVLEVGVHVNTPFTPAL